MMWYIAVIKPHLIPHSANWASAVKEHLLTHSQGILLLNSLKIAHVTITIKDAEVKVLQRGKDFLHLFPYLQNHA